MDSRTFELYKAAKALVAALEIDAPTQAGWNNDVNAKKEDLLDVLAQQGDPRISVRATLHW